MTVDSGTTAAGGETSQLSSTISSGTANTVVSGTLIGSPTTINAGDRVSTKFGGLLTLYKEGLKITIEKYGLGANRSEER